MSKKQYLTAGEVAELFGVTVQTVHNWREAGDLPCEESRLPGRTRKRYRFPAAEVRRLAKRWVKA